jgi:uncharacterized protein (DUF305 family)
MTRPKIIRPAVLALLLTLSPIVASAQDEPLIIQPGPPGEASREITLEEASNLAGLLHTEADVKFMQGMIMHHAQALDMTALVEGRSATPGLATLADRIERTQADEIRMMQEWLATNGYEVTSEHAHHAHDAERMPGMLTPEEMASLEDASKVEFDRLFLELMISHHKGALTMVDELLENEGAAQEPTIFRFTADIVADQGAEIGRMTAMLESLVPDPRVGLAAGYLDAEEAAWNLELVASLPRPEGFYSPISPAGLPVPEEEEEAEGDEEEADDDSEGDEEMTEEEKEEAERLEEAEGLRQSMIEEAKARARLTALFSFANTDLAFAGDRVVVGNYHGFNSYDISDPVLPRLLSSVVCPGGQADPSIVGDLMILSVEENRGRLDCGLQGVAGKVSPERFRGIRIFDISDLARPRQVAAVQTCRGSHTHTVVTDPDDEGNFYVYVSGTAGVREGEELEGCSDEHPGDDENTALFSIDVVQVPVENPENARIVSRPRIFADPETGRIAGLWKGGDHGRGTQRTWRTDQCHDITVFPELGLAAGACSGNGILLDISDPENPVRLDAVVDSGFAYWHSATFNNDGTKVLFTDEWGGGMRPRCQASDPKTWGADAIYDIVDGKLEFRGYYKLPAPQSESENCVAHNGSLVPVPGRDIMVQAWYQGGISIFDFTDSANPVEIAFFDRGPLDEEEVLLGGPWSTYWHNGMIYSSEIARGLDVLKLVPSEHLTQNELDAAATIDSGIVNAQYQRKFVWPAEPVVARAYVDQLARSGALDEAQIEALTSALDGAASAPRLGELATAVEEDVKDASETDRARGAALALVLRDLAGS